jgi:hypothetical protein
MTLFDNGLSAPPWLRGDSVLDRPPTGAEDNTETQSAATHRAYAAWNAYQRKFAPDLFHPAPDDMDDVDPWGIIVDDDEVLEARADADAALAGNRNPIPADAGDAPETSC